MKRFNLKKEIREFKYKWYIKKWKWRMNAYRRFHLQRRRLGLGQIRPGSLRRLEPVSREFGFDRGQPIDRYYIEDFLRRYSNDIRGHVLEFKDSYYTRKFGGCRITKSDVLNIENDNPASTIVADLMAADHIPSDLFDCIIFTQTLQVIYNTQTALSCLYRILKPGGVLLAAFPGISKIVKNQIWDDYWRFTSASSQKLFENFFPPENITIKTYGNVFTAIAVLHGLAAEELERKELQYEDPAYEVIITVRVVKPLNSEKEINFL